MKRSFLLKYINSALLLGLLAPSAQIFSKDSIQQQTFRALHSVGKQTYAAAALGTAWGYAGITRGLKMVGDSLNSGKEKSIKRAQKELKHVTAGLNALYKRARGRALTKKEAAHLHSMEKRALAILLFLLMVTGTVYKFFTDSDSIEISDPTGFRNVSEEERQEAERVAKEEEKAEHRKREEQEKANDAPLPDSLTNSFMAQNTLPESIVHGDDASNTLTGSVLKTNELPPHPEAEGKNEAKTPSPEPSMKKEEEGLLHAKLRNIRAAVEESILEPSPESSIIEESSTAPTVPKTIKEFTTAINEAQKKLAKTPEREFRKRAALAREIKNHEAAIRKISIQSDVAKQMEKEKEKHKNATLERPNPLDRALQAVEGMEEEEDDDDTSWTKSQIN